MSELVLRPWEPTDHDVLVGQAYDCLAELHAAGSDLLPTLDNAERFWRIGMHWTTAGDPTLCATLDDRIVAWVLWGGIEGDFQRALRVCHGHGTYVVPTERRRGIASVLRRAAGVIAKRRGYGKVVGTMYDEPGRESGRAAGFVPVATQMEWTL